jgi:hypothetical protein
MKRIFQKEEDLLIKIKQKPVQGQLTDILQENFVKKENNSNENPENLNIYFDFFTTKYSKDYKLKIVEGKVREIINNFN